MTGPAAAYARIVVRLRFVVVVGWILAGWWALQQPHVDLTRGGAGLRDLAPVDLPSVQAELRAAHAFPIPLHSRTLAVQHDPEGLPPAAQRAIVERAAPADEPHVDWPDLAAGIPLINQPPLAGSLPPPRTTAVTYLVFRPDVTATARTRQATSFANAAPEEAGDTGITGAVPARISTARVLRDSLPRLEVVTAAVITAVVAAFYRSLVAPLVVLVTIGMAYVVSQAALATFARAYDREVPREVEPLLVALLLGVVTDYCVFFLSAMRRRMREGLRRREAAIETITTTAPIVLVAALTVAAGCAALMLARTEFLAAFGPALALTVVVAGAVALTLVPALIAILGGVAFWPTSIRRAGRGRRSARTPMSLLLRSRWVTGPVMVLVLVGLVAASLPVLDMRLGYDAISGLPDDDPVDAGQQLATEGFPPGIVAPTVLLVEGAGLGRSLPSLVRLQRQVEREPGVAGSFGAGTVDAVRRLAPPGETPDVRDPLGLAVAADGSAARMLLVLGDDPYGGRAVQRLESLRSELPELVRRSGLPAGTRATVAGDTAVVLELVDELRGDLARVAGGVILLDLLLLAAFLRSALAPLVVVGGSVLAVAASLGTTTWVFQEYLGADGIAFYVPLATLVLLLSLGADYGVFSIGHAWGIARRRPLRDSLVRGSAETSTVIALAGVLLGASFALLALVPVQAFMQFAVAMSLGVLLDTFVIRPVLLPTAIRTLGDVSMWPRRPGTETGDAGDVEGAFP